MAVTSSAERHRMPHTWPNVVYLIIGIWLPIAIIVVAVGYFYIRLRRLNLDFQLRQSSLSKDYSAKSSDVINRRLNELSDELERIIRFQTTNLGDNQNEIKYTIDRALNDMEGRISASLADRLLPPITATQEAVEAQLHIARPAALETNTSPSVVVSPSVVSEMAHAMKTPLAHMEGALILLRTDLSGQDLEETLTSLSASVATCKATLAAYRELSKISGQADSWAPESLGDALRSMHRVYAKQLGSHATLKVDVPDSIDGYSNSFVLVILLPLLENAVEASSAGVISITANIDSSENEFIIVNTADSPANLQGIDRPGVSSKHGHDGIGISIVKRLVEDYTGASVQHDYNPATREFTFRITLPGRIS